MEPLAWRRLPLLMLAAVWCGLLPAVAAADPLAEARGLLARIQAAASGGNYQGTLVFTIGGTMSSSRVGHWAVGDQTYELLEALDGRQQRVLRHNDEVHTLWPQLRLAVIEKRDLLAQSASTPQSVEPQALRHYDMRPEGRGRVAGRDASVFLLEPRDLLRYAQRLWADEASGLMLRADVMGLAAAQGLPRPVLESTAFSEVLIGVRPQPDLVLQQMRQLRKLEGYKVVRPHHQRSSLEAEGWVLGRRVNGFDLAGCVRRGMDTAGDEQPVLQAVFSDGLTHVSLFIEPYSRERHRAEMQSQQGATATLTQRRGEHWITAVGDVPPATLKLFVDALERRRP